MGRAVVRSAHLNHPGEGDVRHTRRWSESQCRPRRRRGQMPNPFPPSRRSQGAKQPPQRLQALGDSRCTTGEKWALLEIRADDSFTDVEGPTSAGWFGIACALLGGLGFLRGLGGSVRGVVRTPDAHLNVGGPPATREPPCAAPLIVARSTLPSSGSPAPRSDSCGRRLATQRESRRSGRSACEPG